MSTIGSRISRVGFEAEILHALAESPCGLALGEIRPRFEGRPVTHVLEHLVDRGQVNRYDGLVYSITELGRSRLAPPVCVVAS